MVTHSDIKALELALPLLKAKDASFAANLIKGFKKYGNLTPKQTPWVAVLIDRAKNPSAPAAAPSVSLGDFAPVVALFAKGKGKLKFPKITLSVGGTLVKLSLAGPTSKNAGSINVMGEGSYPNRAWFGKITPEGTFFPAAAAAPIKAGLVDLLTKLGSDPAGVAKEFGKLTGNCCFCNKVLGLGEDKRSVNVGFGPVCADHYGLTAEWKAAAGDVVTVPTLTVSPGAAAEIAAIAAELDAEKAESAECFFCEKNPGMVLRKGLPVCASCVAVLDDTGLTGVN